MWSFAENMGPHADRAVRCGNCSIRFVTYDSFFMARIRTYTFWTGTEVSLSPSSVRQPRWNTSSKPTSEKRSHTNDSVEQISPNAHLWETGRRCNSLTTSPEPTRRASTTSHWPTTSTTAGFPVTGNDTGDESVPTGAVSSSQGSVCDSPAARNASQSSSNARSSGGGSAGLQVRTIEGQKHNNTRLHYTSLTSRGRCGVHGMHHFIYSSIKWKQGHLGVWLLLLWRT